MTWLASIGVGILTAIIGAFGTYGMGDLCVRWYRISPREGGSGVFVVLLALLGGFVGFLVGVVSARIVASGAAPGFFKSLALGAGSVVGLVVITTFICWLAADLPTTIDGDAAELHGEVRCPPGFAIRAADLPDDWNARLDTRTREMTSHNPLRVNEARQEDGRWIIPVTLGINTSVREKLLYVWLGEKAGTRLFTPIFSSKPVKRDRTWSGWLESSEDPDKPRLASEDRFELRFRIDRVPPPEPMPAPSGPSKAELKAQLNAQEAAAFAALTPESPLEDLLKFTLYSQPEDRRLLAGAMIGRRPGVVAEMSAQILSSNQETSNLAMRALAFIKPLPAELAVPVAQVGEKIIAALRTFNASKPSDDPHYQGAADIALLFTGWFEGPHALHNYAGVDGRAQLRQIVELAEQRQDSSVLQDHVARPAKSFITKWTPVPVLK
jgi:hypothetical protein